MIGLMISNIFFIGFEFYSFQSSCQMYSDSDSLNVTQEAHLG